MVYIGLILGLVYSRFVQQSVYNYFDALETLPSALQWVANVTHLPSGLLMQWYKSGMAIIMLGLVPALIVIGCLLLQFLVEAIIEERRTAAFRTYKPTEQNNQTA
ncbi:MAG TPA: hypothetical protein GXX29_12540 [Firmicutes bacterium]|nr:hypothetical protein [Bacillota bacterium]